MVPPAYVSDVSSQTVNSDIAKQWGLTVGGLGGGWAEEGKKGKIGTTVLEEQ